MASNKNITMRQFNGIDYDYLYPRTTTDQVSGLYDNIYTKSQSDGLYLKTNGSNAMTGNLNVGNHYLSNVANPNSPQDAATKQYVDSTVVNVVAGTWRELNTVSLNYSYDVNGEYLTDTGNIVPTGVDIRGIKALRITVQTHTLHWVAGNKNNGDTGGSVLQLSPFGPTWSNYSNNVVDANNQYFEQIENFTANAIPVGSVEQNYQLFKSFYITTNRFNGQVQSISAINKATVSGDTSRIEASSVIQATIKVYGLF